MYILIALGKNIPKARVREAQKREKAFINFITTALTHLKKLFGGKYEHICRQRGYN